MVGKDAGSDAGLVIQCSIMQKTSITFFLFFCLQVPLLAQNRQVANHVNAWLMYFGTHKFASKWSVHLEAQWRRNQWVQQPQQLLLRTAMNYQVASNLQTSIGYCYVYTYPYGEFPVSMAFPEHRIWEQIQTRQQIGKLEWVNRYRMEQRFMYPNGEVLVYQNRFRFLTRISIPFSGQEIRDRSLYFSAYNESMISFGKQVKLNAFDQNRAYAALGYKVPGLGRLELGYLLQILLKSDGVRQENNHTLQVGLTTSFPIVK
jgi:hypothetical protein